MIFGLLYENDDFFSDSNMCDLCAKGSYKYV